MTFVITAAQAYRVATVGQTAQAAPVLEIEGDPKVEDTGEKGNDGSPKLKVTITFKGPIPAGFTKGKLEVCTFSPQIKCWAQVSPFDVKPGDKSITVEAWFNHSLDFNKKDPKKGEHALLKVNNPTTKQTIEVRFDVDIPGDF